MADDAATVWDEILLSAAVRIRNQTCQVRASKRPLSLFVFFQVGSLRSAAQPSAVSSATTATRAEAATSAAPISQERLAQVQRMIEECLRVYMSLDDICEALRVQHAVDPAQTRAIYAALKHDSPDFFLVYELRLRVKEQIAAFNFVVAQQVLVQQQGAQPAAQLVRK